MLILGQNPKNGFFLSEHMLQKHWLKPRSREGKVASPPYRWTSLPKTAGVDRFSQAGGSLEKEIDGGKKNCFRKINTNQKTERRGNESCKCNIYIYI